MGTDQATMYPLQRAEVALPTASREKSAGSFYFRFDVARGSERASLPSRKAQFSRTIAAIIGEAIGRKPAYQRKDRIYEIGGWTVTAGCTVLSQTFCADAAGGTLRVLCALKGAGLAPDGEVQIAFAPEAYDAHMVLNLCNIMVARRSLIVRALGLNDEIRIIIDCELTFGVPLSAFDTDALEACVCLLRQASLQAETVGKARMQPCNGSNPKFQMRSWLLRLGLIGEEFARPRRTLLRNLEGNSAFFDERGKDMAAMKRRACRAEEGLR